MECSTSECSVTQKGPKDGIPSQCVCPHTQPHKCLYSSPAGDSGREFCY